MHGPGLTASLLAGVIDNDMDALKESSLALGSPQSKESKRAESPESGIRVLSCLMKYMSVIATSFL